jgi:hypothetical protein
MRVRDRLGPEDAVPQLALAPSDGDGESDALRDEGAAFLAAADDAISRALSRDSEQFLSQNRQMGGQ